MKLQGEFEGLYCTGLVSCELYEGDPSVCVAIRNSKTGVVTKQHFTQMQALELSTNLLNGIHTISETNKLTDKLLK